MRFLLLAVLLSSAVVTGCNESGTDSASNPALPNTVADGEAARAAAIYRYMQGLGSIMLGYLSDPNTGVARAGTVACSGGGAVAISDTTLAVGADPQVSLQFSECAEPIGLISGTMDARYLLIRLNSENVGSFNVAWTADVVVDGYVMTFESNSGLVTRSPGGAVMIETFGGADLAMSLTAPTGASVLFSDVRIAIAYDPTTGLADFGGSNLRMRSLNNADLGAKLLPSGLRAPVSVSAALHSVGVPVTGSFSYQRSFDPTATDVLASGVTNSGLLSLTVEPLPSKNFSGSAGQYSWPELISAPELSLPAVVR